jgi:hypothetical protein
MMSRRRGLWSLGAINAAAIAPTLLLGSPATGPESAPASAALPNIVYILSDDLGYGDVQSLNPLRGKISTPHLDHLATQGMIFTNAHAASSVCTPSRYGILTDRYSWRSRLQTFILSVYDPPLITADRLTVPGLLQQHGYHTSGTGKWHLGCNVPMEGDAILLDRAIRDGPVTRGFDEYRGADFRKLPPYMYTENDRFVGTAAPHQLPSHDGGKTFANQPHPGPPAMAKLHKKEVAYPILWKGELQIADPANIGGLWVRISDERAEGKPSAAAICKGDVDVAGCGYWKNLGCRPTVLEAAIC